MTDTEWDQVVQKLRVMAIDGGSGASCSLPLSPTPLFHVEHSPISRIRQSDPDSSTVVDMEATNRTECSTWNIPQDSPLPTPLDYSGGMDNDERHEMNITEALQAFTDALVTEVTERVNEKMERVAEMIVRDEMSGTDFLSESDVESIVSDLLSGATIEASISL